MTSRSQGTRNRQLGHDAERWYAKKFREWGFTKCITSRKGSRYLDDMGIDLMFLPVNVQVKAGHQRGLNYGTELKMMAKRITTMPDTMKQKAYPNILIHKKYVGQGQKRNIFDELVILSYSDYMVLLKKAYLK